MNWAAVFASVPAALEFAVLLLEVEHVTVLGHGQCGGIHALMSGTGASGEFIGKWMSKTGSRARTCRASDRAARLAGAGLRTGRHPSLAGESDDDPWIFQRVTTGAMHLHGWYFDIAQGELMCYNPAHNGFEPIGENTADQSGVMECPNHLYNLNLTDRVLRVRKIPFTLTSR
jgi:carbonic anhydrase